MNEKGTYFSFLDASFLRASLYSNKEGVPVDVIIIEGDQTLARLAGLPIEQLRGMLLSSLFSHLGNGMTLINRLVQHQNLQTEFYCEFIDKMVLFTAYFLDDSNLCIVISPTDSSTEKINTDVIDKSANIPLKTYFETAYNWEYWVDTERNIKMMSPSCERITGYKPEEFIIDRELILRITHPDDLTNFKDFISHEKHDMDFRIIHKSGQIRWIKHVCQPVINEKGQFLGRRVSNVDITELKELNDELDEARRRLHTLISNLPGLVYRCKNDPSWTMEFISQGALELTGYPPEAFINNNRLSFHDIIHPDHRDRLWNKWQELLSQKESFYDEYPIITASGETKWVLERGCGVFDENGNLLALEGFIWDHTTNHQLIEDLKIKSQELSDANEMKDKLLSVIAHDLKNSLGNIIGYSELLFEDFSAMDDETRKEMVQFIHHAANLTDNLLTNLLDWSRLKHGRYESKYEMIDLSALIAEIILINRNIANQKSIRIHSHVPPSTFIRTDAYAVSIILRNFISNAIKFTMPGKSIRVFLRVEEMGLWSINVEDEGISLSKEEIEKILSPNVISSKPGTSGEKGTGMGLKLSLGFAELIGANIKAHSRPDCRGMVFSLVLPRN